MCHACDCYWIWSYLHIPPSSSHMSHCNNKRPNFSLWHSKHKALVMTSTILGHMGGNTICRVGKRKYLFFFFFSVQERGQFRTILFINISSLLDKITAASRVTPRASINDAKKKTKNTKFRTGETKREERRGMTGRQGGVRSCMGVWQADILTETVSWTVWWTLSSTAS